MIFITSIVLLFILKIRYPTRVPISISIRSRYGYDGLRKFRKVEGVWRKLAKAEEDLKFLTACKAYGSLPKFLAFKLYRASLQNTESYRNYQTLLLDNEIEHKRKTSSQLNRQLTESKSLLKGVVSHLDFSCLNLFIRRRIDKYIDNVKTTHERKLAAVGAKSNLTSVDPSKVIFNYSDKSLTDRERFLLSFGLDFNLPIFKLSFYKFFLPFELFINRLKRIPMLQGCTFNSLRDQIKHKASEMFYGFKSSKVFSPIFKKSDIKLLRDLGKDDNISICSPDKGKGVVIFNKVDYLFKMNTVLSDTTKFSKLENSDSFTLTIKLEDKVNRFLAKLKKLGAISDSVYKQLFASGSAPGILYGLAKIHKANVPLRPILAAYKTATYKIAKYLIPLIDPYCTNEYVLKNSYQFHDLISKFPAQANYFMVSYDVSSLYTNVPVLETVEILCNNIFSINDSIFNGFTRKNFTDFLKIALTDTLFIFNKVLYKQVDGLAMGNPMAPTMANAFLCHLENNFLASCPSEFKPVLYRRYLDDTFVIFRQECHAKMFLDYINDCHSNINFTMETESGGRLAFLDTTVERHQDHFSLSVYRKPTFTGLGTSFFSFTSYIFKVNAVRTLVHRAYHLSSTYLNFTIELDFLRNFFESNGYPKFLVEKVIRVFLDKIFSPKPNIATVEREKFYISLPFIGPPSCKFVKHFQRILPRYYPQINFKFSLKNSFRIRSLLNHKDKLPAELRSDIIYQYTCGICHDSYIGSSSKQSKIRFHQHLGRSFRTNNPLTSPSISSPRNHSENNDHPLKYCDFSIIDSASNEHDLRILESLYIYDRKPNLNIDQSAVPLHVV